MCQACMCFTIIFDMHADLICSVRKFWKCDISGSEACIIALYKSKAYFSFNFINKKYFSSGCCNLNSL
uniref:Uncharacterized protein n=1 Tax=Populus trichocarpa TaxID=3694 RepID=A0A2K1ZHI1_POPTR